MRIKIHMFIKILNTIVIIYNLSISKLQLGQSLMDSSQNANLSRRHINYKYFKINV